MDERIDVRNYDELTNAIVLAQHTVYKKYFTELEHYPLVTPTACLLDESAKDCVRFFQLEELSCKRGEDIFQKLSTVYHASMTLGCSLIVMIDVGDIYAPAKIYIGVRNSGEDDDAMSRLGTSFRTLQNGLKSNFPGTKFHNIESEKEMPKLLNEIFCDDVRYISSVSSIASIRDKSKTENKSFIQGLERFVDVMRGHTYTAIFIAEPITSSEQQEMRNGYESLYSTLSSFSKSVWSYNENESKAVSESLSDSVSKSITDGTAKTQSHTFSVGMNIGIEGSKSSGSSTTNTETTTNSSPTTAARVGQALVHSGGLISGACKCIGLGAFLINPALGVGIMKAGNMAAAAAPVVGGFMQGASISHSIASAVINSVGKSLGLSGGLNAGYANTRSNTQSHDVTNTLTQTKTSGTTDTTGTGKTLQIEMINKPIVEMLNQIEEHLKRIKEGEDYGAYSCGAYFLSGKEDSSLIAANTYRALMLGEGSSAESGAINAWNGKDEPEKISAMKDYLKRFVHPTFAVAVSNEKDSDLLIYTPGTVVSGLELPLHLGLPTKSVYGLPVLEYAEFGRNIITYDRHEKAQAKLNIGKIFHMNAEEKADVSIFAQSLASHTFITGSTGSGKSNTVYQILKEARNAGIKFLVVEPAKGEYKSVFGMYEDVSVYGTNPELTPMLRINPFSFPKGIHILEHLDRLVEIFNVCWPMYAAMPAVLKMAVEDAYSECGWNLNTSRNKYGENIFPTFADVAAKVKSVIDSSEYDNENKGAYKGALLTRLQSLANGINGIIFVQDEISASDLYDKNVIVDLSRVGSSETKSLIMGMLVLKLQEYRMTTANGINEPLKHITVLEEAHNLLKRTSTEQSSETANLAGKSVEMLANAIAEMRTYGEGFVIVDQAPGLLDLSAIRNTNTKMIMRLPDLTDRELAGKAANLNDDQIIELAKLPCGVAAVYQNEWIQPVLCKVNKFAHTGEPYSYIANDADDIYGEMSIDAVKKELLDCIMNKEIFNKDDRHEIRMLKDAVLQSNVSAMVKCDFMEYIAPEKENEKSALRKLVYDLFEAEKAIKASKDQTNISEWVHSVAKELQPSVINYPKNQIDSIVAWILHEQAVRDSSYDDVLVRFVEVCQNEGGVF